MLSYSVNMKAYSELQSFMSGSCAFVCVQRETLLRQLETNQLDMDATLEELCVQQETEDQNYEMYVLLLFFLFLSLYCTDALEGHFSGAQQIVFCVHLLILAICCVRTQKFKHVKVVMDRVTF